MDIDQSNHDPMCEVTAVDDLKKLLQLLKQDLPNSADTYNIINIKLKAFPDNARIFVTRGNNCNRGVVWKMNNFTMVGVTCPLENVTFLKQALLHSSLIDCNAPQRWTVPESLVSMVMEVLRECFHIEPTVTVTMQSFYMSPEEGLSLKPWQCDDGLVCTLGEAGIRRMYDTWAYSYLFSYKSVRDFAILVPSIGLYLHPTAAATQEISPPSTGVTDDVCVAAGERPCYSNGPDDEVPVSWASMNPSGDMGKLLTEKKYRRRGYAQIIAREFCRLMAWEGYVPLSMADTNNIPSLAFHQKCGFTLGQQNFTMVGVTCLPENAPFLKKALLHTSFIDYTAPLQWTVPESLVSMVEEVLRERLHNEPTVTHIMQSFYMTPEEGLSLKPWQCDDGLVCTLGEAGIRRMYDTWAYSHVISYKSVRDFAILVPSIGLYLHPTAAATQEISPPSTGVTDDVCVVAGERPCYSNGPDDEVPVSWASMNSKGGMGKLQTEEKYRRRGYARIIAREYCRLIAWEGYVPLSMAETHNTPSISFHQKCGFTLGQKVYFIKCMPDQVTPTK